jgi:hypothetical protein
MNPEQKPVTNDPARPQFRSKKIMIYHSFEEANEGDALEAAMIPPVERLRETVKLILRVYGVTEEQLHNRRKLKLNVIKYE